MSHLSFLVGILACLLTGSPAFAEAAEGTAEPRPGHWQSLFNSEDLTGWRVSPAAAQSWTVVGGVINCDPRSTEQGDANLWTEASFGDFVLYIEWRITDTPTVENVPVLLATGETKRDEQGRIVTERIANADSGIYLRGQAKAQVNIWNWPVGSGEVWGYRTDRRMSDEVRAAVTPRVRADNPVGQWNTFVITMIGDRLTVMLNGEMVIHHAQLPGVAQQGPLALQYHGGYDHENQRYRNASSLVQFRNIRILPLNTGEEGDTSQPSASDDNG